MTKLRQLARRCHIIRKMSAVDRSAPQRTDRGTIGDNRTVISPSVPTTLALVLIFLACCRVMHADDSRVAVRVQTLTVPPSTQPVMQVDARNLTRVPYRGSLTIQGPENWQLSPPSRNVSLSPGETLSFPFSIEQARTVASNEYVFDVALTGAAGDVTHQQTVFVASAPYYKPTLDGLSDDWQDAIPVTFAKQGRQTTVSTYWNRRQFSLLVTVEEAQLAPYQAASENNAPLPPDAIQVSIAPLESATDAADGKSAGRFEFLIAAAQDGARCFRLADPETALEDVRRIRDLDDLICHDVEAVVRRNGALTIYECSFSFRPMRDSIRPMEGREFYFSVLVHDPDGTGVRDVGRAAGLWASPDDADAWSRWSGAVWGDVKPRGNKVRWGLCTSKY